MPTPYGVDYGADVPVGSTPSGSVGVGYGVASGNSGKVGDTRVTDPRSASVPCARAATAGFHAVDPDNARTPTAPSTKAIRRLSAETCGRRNGSESSGCTSRPYAPLTQKA